MVAKLEALNKVREAERQVSETKAKAQTEKEKILRKAKGEALTLEEQLREEVEKRYEEILEKARRSTEEERKTILEKGRQDAAAIKAVAADRVERAVELLLRRFEEAIHAEA